MLFERRPRNNNRRAVIARIGEIFGLNKQVLCNRFSGPGSNANHTPG